jgi:ComF family protein
MIHHLKYSGFIEIAEMLGELMVLRIRRENIPKDILLIPVPLYKSRESERGFNQSEIITKYISKKTNIPYKNGLLRNRSTLSQVLLSGTERRENLDGVFTCTDKRSIRGKNILLVDDVTTTYSTLNECAKELISAGAKKVYGLVVARG